MKNKKIQILNKNSKPVILLADRLVGQPPSKLAAWQTSKVESWLASSLRDQKTKRPAALQGIWGQQVSRSAPYQASKLAAQLNSRHAPQHTSRQEDNQSSRLDILQTRHLADQQSSKLAVQQTSSPADQQSSRLAVHQTSSPADYQSSRLAVQQDAVQQTISPADQKSFRLIVQQTSSPADKQTSIPAFQQISRPVDQHCSRLAVLAGNSRLSDRIQTLIPRPQDYDATRVLTLCYHDQL